MAITPEGRVKAQVKKVLAERGAYYYMPVSNGMGRVGAPDFIVCWYGQFIGIETKAPGKRNNTTPNQERELDWIESAGGLAVVVDDAAQLQQVFSLASQLRSKHAQVISAETQVHDRVREQPRAGQASGGA